MVCHHHDNLYSPIQTAHNAGYGRLITVSETEQSGCYERDDSQQCWQIVSECPTTNVEGRERPSGVSLG